MTSSHGLLPHRVLASLLLTLAAVAAPHALHLPPWLTAVVVICGVWRYMAGRNAWRMPPRPLLIVLTLLCAGGVALSYGTIAGRDAGVALLNLLIGLKLLEMRNRRDTVVVLFLGYFLIATQFLFSQSLFTAGWMLLMVWAMTALLITISRPTGHHLSRQHVRMAGAMVLQALPVMVMLFVLFPRLPGPLWGMPEDDARGVTGLGGEMTPGMISELIESDAVAFRVEFDGAPPAPSQRYWRGPVLPSYDGRTWRRLRSDQTLQPPLEVLGPATAYTVTLEPHNKHWLFTLDMPVELSEPVQLGSEYELQRNEAVRERIRYRARSHLNYRLDPGMAITDPALYRYLPDDVHPRTRALARRWLAEAEDRHEVIDRALDHFREEQFVYTLRPQVARRDAVDEFMFDSRRGFCESYAAAFTVLMRAAGIPARIVTGYQGGEMNALGDYMIVRQSDAHAWVEVWREGRGWIRVDPTASIAPDRIELGVASAVDGADALPLMARRESTLLRQLGLRWDAVNAYWDRWVLAYGPSLQQRLLSALGITSIGRTVAILAAALAVCVLLVALFVLWQRPARPADPSTRLWQELVQRLARRGAPPRRGEGPQDYIQRVADQQPALRAPLREALAAYLRLRYGRRPADDDLERLRKAVRLIRR